MPSRFDKIKEELEDLLNEPDWDSWQCVKCNKHFIDPDDFPRVQQKNLVDVKIERRTYWLSTTELVCHNCATAAGIPSIDEEENGR